eukprot:TRINITY_DN3860_c0_g1_i1.p1 TRINITY_DN3860_c0_g1~~TRINITY_DN3860_c0_g1_i1.p1  ORF type:complete len:107 (-),score=18.54 TRINITY_DN3860_c0_g1_i1:37-357(-)
MNHQEVAEMTHKLFSEGYDANTVAQKLVNRAIKDLQTEDNVTVIVVKIDWESETSNSQSTSDVTTDTINTTNTEITSNQVHAITSADSDGCIASNGVTTTTAATAE